MPEHPKMNANKNKYIEVVALSRDDRPKKYTNIRIVGVMTDENTSLHIFHRKPII